MENNYCLYIHTAPNGKVYIGITSRKPETRWKNGAGYYSPHFRNAIQMYGWENIRHEVILTGLTKETACQMEKNFIQLYDSSNPEKGYNQTYGGEEGLKLTPVVREKISIAKKRFYSNPVNRKAVSERMIGQRKSVEARERMSKSHTGLTHVATKEWKENISKSLKSHYSDPENRKKHQKDFKRFSDIGKASAMRVMQLDDNMNVIASYESMKEASRKTGIKDGNISSCCHGKRKHAGGYIWRLAG